MVGQLNGQLFAACSAKLCDEYALRLAAPPGNLRHSDECWASVQGKNISKEISHGILPH